MLQLAAPEMAPTDLRAFVNCSPLKWEGFRESLLTKRIQQMQKDVMYILLILCIK